MYRSRKIIFINTLSCIILVFLMVNSGPPATTAANEPQAHNGPLTVNPLVYHVADRAMNMRLENWDWDSGVAMYGMLKAWEATGDQRYFDFVKSWVDGVILHGLPPIIHPNQAAPGIATLMLYEVTGQAKYLAAAQQMADDLMNAAPRTSEGALYHYEDQLWVDTLFMTAPFLSRLSRVTGDPRYAEEAVRQFRLHARHLQDPKTGLFFHGWDESEAGHMSGAFWQRGNGWAMAAGAELLDQLPADHPARSEIRDILIRQAEGLLPLQDSSGLWHTVVDQPDFYPETSGAAAIGYALFRGLDQGWLDPSEFSTAAQQARHGVESKVSWDGTVLDVSNGTGVLPNRADYNAILHDTIQPWGQGLALLELTQRPYGFHLSVGPSMVLVTPGRTAQVDVVTTNTYGTMPGFDLSLAGALPSVSWSFSDIATPTAITGGRRAQLTLTTTPATPVGSHPLTVSARSQELTRTTELTLQVATMTHSVYLPLLAKHSDGTPLFPNLALANKIWQAIERFVEVRPIYPGYTPEAGGPSLENARANVEAACLDFPDLPDLFGAGAHHHACYDWVASYLGRYHATRAYRSRSDGFSHQSESNDDILWAQHYFDLELDYLTEFVYGPEDSPTGVSYRDTLAAIWQNPLRAASVTIFADLLRKQSALGAERQARVEELLSGIVRAWYAEFWETGQHPNPGTPFTINTAPDTQAYSLAGHQVVSTYPWTFHWDADKGNTSAEEMAWMGAGIMLASRVLSDRMADAGDIYAAARHYVDFAVTFDRPDPTHGGTIRTLNAETAGGAYGQRRYWIENHAPDMPSIPYVGFTWHFMNTALLASDLGDQRPWPELVPDDTQWQVLLRSAGETMRAADGTFLIDFTPGRGIGFNLDNFPAWWMPCGQGTLGKQYVRYDGRAGGPEIYVSEIGHPAGLDLVAAGWPLMRIAAHRGDESSYGVWEGRLNQILDEYIVNPPTPHWAVCKTAAYVSTNPGYHWARMLWVYTSAYLGASGYQVRVWEE